MNAVYYFIYRDVGAQFKFGSLLLKYINIMMYLSELLG